MEAIYPVATDAPALTRLGPAESPAASGGFAQMLMAGLATVDQKVATADALVRQFTLGENVPVHQVTLALEEARLAMELAVQVRTQIIAGYRDLMNMQL
jgi:flagellar hook-basal body complex protein FliE